MASRTGNVIKLRDLFTEAHARTAAILSAKWQELSSEDIDCIGVGAIKYSYLWQDREKDITFDWDKALAFEGNSGPYIQYTYVRAKNIIEKSGKIWEIKSTESVENLTEYDTTLIKQLLRFDEAVLDAATKYKPHILAQYCYNLASSFNGFYAHTPKILEESDENLKNIRLMLVKKTRDILQKGFELLAIKMPSKM
jgi:arginyl-tRNA synthetase